MKIKHTMKLNDAPYDMIKSGQKTVEQATAEMKISAVALCFFYFDY